MAKLSRNHFPALMLLFIAGAVVLFVVHRGGRQQTAATQQPSGEQVPAVAPAMHHEDPMSIPAAASMSQKRSPSLATTVPSATMPPFPLGANMSAGDRIQAAKTIPRNLPLEQQQQILAFLPYITHLSDTPIDSRQLLSEILFQNLRLQQDPLPDLPGVLQAIYRDTGTDIIIRGYAVQHIGSWQLEHPHDPEVEAMLWEAATMDAEPFAGMALIAIDQLVDAGQPIDDQHLDTLSLRIAANPAAHGAARMCALDVCARSGTRQALPAARQLSAPATPLYLRLAAIHAIGLLGDSADAALLTQWSQDEGSHHQIAATKALHNIQQRNAP